MSRVIIVDNSPISYSKNRENAIPIAPFMGDNVHDTELLNLLPLLEALRYMNDVRSVLSLRLEL
jgi:CTD nuclear envelope phosphatase 1